MIPPYLQECAGCFRSCIPYGEHVYVVPVVEINGEAGYTAAFFKLSSNPRDVSGLSVFPFVIYGERVYVAYAP
jgi:hypothetical protein